MDDESWDLEMKETGAGWYFICLQPLGIRNENVKMELGNDCKVRTQDSENFDEEVKSLVSAWFSSFPLVHAWGAIIYYQSTWKERQ